MQAFCYLLKAPDSPGSTDYRHDLAQRKAAIKHWVATIRRKTQLRDAGLYIDDPRDGRKPILKRPAMQSIMFRASPGDCIVIDTIFYNFRSFDDLEQFLNRAEQKRLKVYFAAQEGYGARPDSLATVIAFQRGTLQVKADCGRVSGVNREFTSYRTLGRKPEQRAEMAYILHSLDCRGRTLAELSKELGDIRLSHWRWRVPDEEALETFHTRGKELGIGPNPEVPGHWTS